MAKFTVLTSVREDGRFGPRGVAAVESMSLPGREASVTPTLELAPIHATRRNLILGTVGFWVLVLGACSDQNPLGISSILPFFSMGDAPECPAAWDHNQCSLFQFAFDELAESEVEGCSDYAANWEGDLHPIMELVNDSRFNANINWNPDASVNTFGFSDRFWTEIDDMSPAQQMWELKYVIAHEGAHVFQGPGNGETFAKEEGLKCANSD